MGENWRNRYDSLFLNTPRITSTLAGYRMPRSYGRWPTNNDVVEYLQIRSKAGLKIRFGVELNRVQRATGAGVGNIRGRDGVRTGGDRAGHDTTR